MKKKATPVKIILITAVILTLGALGYKLNDYTNRRPDSRTDLRAGTDSQPESVDEEEALMRISEVHQKSIKNGIEQWTMDAAGVRYEMKRKQAVFDQPSVTFYPENSGEVILKAENGVVKTETNDIDVSGQVHVTTESYALQTEQLTYDNNRHTLTTDKRVMIVGDRFRLEADTMFIDINRDRAVFKGNVKGVLYDNMVL